MPAVAMRGAPPALAGGEEIYAEVRKDKPSSSTATPSSSGQPENEYDLNPPEVRNLQSSTTNWPKKPPHNAIA